MFLASTLIRFSDFYSIGKYSKLLLSFGWECKCKTSLREIKKTFWNTLYSCFFFRHSFEIVFPQFVDCSPPCISFHLNTNESKLLGTSSWLWNATRPNRTRALDLYTRLAVPLWPGAEDLPTWCDCNAAIRDPARARAVSGARISCEDLWGSRERIRPRT